MGLPCRRSSLARSAADVLGEGLIRLTRPAMLKLVKEMHLGVGARRNDYRPHVDLAKTSSLSLDRNLLWQGELSVKLAAGSMGVTGNTGAVT